MGSRDDDRGGMESDGRVRTEKECNGRGIKDVS